MGMLQTVKQLINLFAHYVRILFLFFFYNTFLYTISVHTVHRIPSTFKVFGWVAHIDTKVHMIWIMELLGLVLRLEPAEFGAQSDWVC